eukprot:978352-Prorocentrum_minimum.AAC.1
MALGARVQAAQWPRHSSDACDERDAAGVAAAAPTRTRDDTSRGPHGRDTNSSRVLDHAASLSNKNSNKRKHESEHPDDVDARKSFRE